MDIKKKFERILGIFFQLQAKSFVTMDYLIGKFKVSERTIFRDLKSLESIGIPILHQKSKGYSMMEGYKIQTIKFSEEEVMSLIVAEKIIQKKDTQFIHQHFESALNKVKNSFRYHQKDDVYYIDQKLHINDYSKTPEIQPQVLNNIMHAVTRKNQTTIQYKSANDQENVTRIIEPIGVFQEHNNWYVLAYCHLRKDYRHFRLDRISHISLRDEPYTIDHQNYKDLRLSQQQYPSYNIKLKILIEHAHYIKWDRHLHGFIEEHTDEDYVYMNFIHNNNPVYFTRWLMLYADIAEVMEPASMREALIQILEEGIKKNKRVSI